MFFNFDAKRKTELIKPAQPTFSFGMPGAGVRIDGDSAYTYSAFWACVKIISETIAYLPWHVMQNGQASSIADMHPLDRVVYRKPNPEMDSYTYKEIMLSHALTWGNHYAEIERNRLGDIVALWPIDPETVQVKRDNSDRIVYEVQQPTGTTTVLPARDVFHIRGPSRDGLCGYSVIQMARESISLGLAAEAFGASFFGNGAIPGVVIKNSGGAKLKEEGVKNLLATWNKKNKGPRNFNKTEYLDAGMEIERIGIPPADAQFLETRKFQITEIARWFRIPPHKLADLERSTHSNIESQNIEFVTDSIMPWISRIECQADVSLLREDDYGRYYNKINVKGLLRGDSKTRGEFYKLMASLGAMSIDEIRSKEDMDPIGGAEGDLKLVPLNMTTLERMVQGEVKPTGGVSSNASALMMDTSQRFCKIELKRVEKAHEKNDYKQYLADFYVNHARALVDGFSRPVGIIAEQLGAKLDVDGVLMRFFGDYVQKSADELQNAIETGRLNALLCSWTARKADNLAKQLTETVIREAKSHV
jgi:HK97 family phage portal protein